MRDFLDIYFFTEKRYIPAYNQPSAGCYVLILVGKLYHVVLPATLKKIKVTKEYR